MGAGGGEGAGACGGIGHPASPHPPVSASHDLDEALDGLLALGEVPEERGGKGRVLVDRSDDRVGLQHQAQGGGQPAAAYPTAGPGALGA